MTLIHVDTRLPARDGARRRILEAAIACFARAGFHGTSMQEICATAGMSPGGLYRHFPSKDKIIEAIAESERERIADMMVGVSGDGPVLPALFACGAAHLRENWGTERAALCAEIFAEAQRNSKVREIFNRIDNDVRQKIRSALQLACDRGEFDGSLDIDMTTVMLMAIYDGLIGRMTFQPDMTPDRIEPFLRQMISRMLDVTPAPPIGAEIARGLAPNLEVMS